METPPSTATGTTPCATFGHRLDELVRALVADRIHEAQVAPVEFNAHEPGRWSRPATAGEAVNRLFMLNARQWHLEDLCCASRADDARYGNHKKRIEHCFKTKRPELVRTLNRYLTRAVIPGFRRRAFARSPALCFLRDGLRRDRTLARWRRRVVDAAVAIRRPALAAADRRFVAAGLDHVVFFNPAHNGDLHLSREFVKHLVATIPAARFSFAHFNAPKTLRDLQGVAHVSLHDLHDRIPVEVTDEWNCVVTPGYLLERTTRTLFVNTWIGQQGGRFLEVAPDGTRQATLGANMRLYGALINALGLPRPLAADPCTYFPSVDYSAFEIARVRAHVTAARRGTRVFISDGPVRSRQTDNFAFTPIVRALAERFPAADFYLTSAPAPGGDDLARPNVHRTRDLIGASGGDLNENSFLSLFCDLIVGRESGPFEFCKVRENYLDPAKTFICFTRNRLGAFWHTGPIPARCVWSAATDPTVVERVIAEEVSRLAARDHAPGGG